MALASQQTHKLLQNVALPYKSFTSPVDPNPQFIAGQNVIGSLKGICFQRPGFADHLESVPTTFVNVKRIFGWTRWDGTTEIVMVVDMVAGAPLVYKLVIGVDPSFVLIHTGATFSDPYDFVAENDLVYFSNGADAWKWSPTLGKQLWGIVAPAAPTLTLISGTLNSYAGGWYYLVTYFNQNTGHESSPSPLSTCTGNVANKSVKVAWAASADSQVTHVNIYRTTDGGANNPQQMALLKQVAVGSSPYTDTIPDGSLSATQFAPAFYQNDPPQPMKGIQSYAGRIWGAVQAKVWYSGQEEISNGVPQECFPGASINAADGNFYAYAALVQALAPLPDGIAIETAANIYKIEGDTLDTFRRYTLLAKRGTVNRATVQSIGSSMVWLDRSSQLWLSDSGEISKDIRPDVAAINQAQAMTTIHIAGEEHWICLLDGVRGIIFVYDLDLTQWNVPWIIQGGASAIASIEVLPGINKLAAAIGGKTVCLLNPGLYLDNGRNYSAWVATNLLPIAPESNSDFLGQVYWVSVESNQYQPAAVSVIADDDPSLIMVAVGANQTYGGFQQLTTVAPPSRRRQGEYIKELQYKGVPDPVIPPCRRMAVRLDWPYTKDPSLWAWYSLDLALVPFGK